MVSAVYLEERKVRIVNMGEPSGTEGRRDSRIGGEEIPNNENEQENHVDEVIEETTSDEEDNHGNEEEENISNCSQKSQDTFRAAHCSESMPSSDSNKENIDSNVLKYSCSEFNPSDFIITGEYDNTDQIPLPQLLKIHVKQLVSGFEFGEATKRRAQENMKTARDKNKSEHRKSLELAQSELEKQDDLGKPSCSKTIPETAHKTPHSRKRQRLAESKMNIINSDKDFCTATRRVPDCIIKHPDCREVWMYMIFKEEASLKLRNPRLFNDFKSVTPRMRAILLDWLMEVAAVYHLRRVTYYLSVDYFDRFLSIRPDIPKSLLQLVGITCLYIAAKVEEIYPPNLSEFSYVCDGACKSKEMVSCELLILNSLGWEVVLTTPTDWLNLYMQLHFKNQEIVRSGLSLDFNRDFIFPQYSAYQFTRASQLIDLLSLDPGFLKFGYSVIAAAAMYYMYGEEIALSVSGLSWQQLQPCVDYMEVFHSIVKETPDPRLYSCLGGPNPDQMSKVSSGLMKRIRNGPQNENYSFQTHVASMEYFEKATLYRLSRYTKQESQPENQTSKSKTTDPSLTSEEEAEGNEDESLIDNIKNSLVDDLNSLNKDKLEENQANDDNLMSLDEIFELILSQDDSKSTNHE